jgi:hypothetical protein
MIRSEVVVKLERHTAKSIIKISCGVGGVKNEERKIL